MRQPFFVFLKSPLSRSCMKALAPSATPVQDMLRAAHACA